MDARLWRADIGSSHAIRVGGTRYLEPARRFASQGAECERTLRESYLSLKQLQLQHHAEAVRAGRKPDNTIETRTLRPLARANLQEALRAVAAAQTRFPRLAAGWRSL